MEGANCARGKKKPGEEMKQELVNTTRDDARYDVMMRRGEERRGDDALGGGGPMIHSIVLASGYYSTIDIQSLITA
jgi:hypothetical protein